MADMRLLASVRVNEAQHTLAAQVMREMDMWMVVMVVLLVFLLIRVFAPCLFVGTVFYWGCFSGRDSVYGLHDLRLALLGSSDHFEGVQVTVCERKSTKDGKGESREQKSAKGVQGRAAWASHPIRDR